MLVGGGSECSPTACQGPHHPKADTQARERKEKQGERGKTRRKTRQDIPKKLAHTERPFCRVLPPKDGLKITLHFRLKALSVDCNGSEKRSEGLFGRGWSAL